MWEVEEIFLLCGKDEGTVFDNFKSACDYYEICCEGLDEEYGAKNNCIINRRTRKKNNWYNGYWNPHYDHKIILHEVH